MHAIIGIGDVMETYLIGSISKIIYRSSDNYLIGLFRVKSSNVEEFDKRSISITGYFHDILEGENIKIYGSFVIHPKYGEQFNVSFYEKVIPSDIDSVIDFFTSGLFKGVGDKTASKIVNALGVDAIDLILNDRSSLNKVNSLSKKLKDSIYETIVDYSNSYNIILKLNKLGFTTKESTSIYKNFKLDTEKIIEENIYDFLDLDTLSFKKVDLIAITNGYSLDDDRRVERTILQTLFEYTNLLGHSYLNYDDLFNYTMSMLKVGISKEVFDSILNRLIVSFKIIKDDDMYYLKYMFMAEDNIVKRIMYLNSKKLSKNIINDTYIKKLEEENNLKYDKLQLDAIKKSIKNNFFIITGGPGTGKTTIVKSIISMYQKVNDLSYKELLQYLVLLAPTGRASKRLSEKSIYPASTIHSFLKWNKENNKFLVNEYNRSDAKIVIIDEASMVDFLLFDSLLKGLKNDCQIIMVGDYNQLPSVGPGQLLKDLIESEKIEVLYLTKLYRQKGDSSIIEFANNLNNGKLDIDLFNKKDDLVFISANDIVEKTIEICRKMNFSLYDNFQVLAPMYKGLNGIDRLNKYLQEYLNPKDKNKKEIKIGDQIYRENDKVLQLVNIPEEKIFNGDIGFIREINSKELIIDFDGIEIKYTPSSFNNFTLGYAISIHKSQGSEFDNVIVTVDNSYGRMLYLKIYYTAVTRAKKNLYIIGSENSLVIALNNNEQDIRKTNIKNKLIIKI